MYVSHLILYLRCQFHGNIPNDYQDIANLLLGYFNLGHPVQAIFKKFRTDFDETFGGLGCGIRKNGLDFGGDPVPLFPFCPIFFTPVMQWLG